MKYKHLKKGNALYSIVEEIRQDIDWFGFMGKYGISKGTPCQTYAVLISERLANRYPEREIYPVFGAMTARYSKHKSGCVNFGSMLANKSYFAFGGFKGHAWIEMKAAGRTFWIDATLGPETQAAVHASDAQLGIDTTNEPWPFENVTIFEAKQARRKDFEQVRDAYEPMFAYYSDGKNEAFADDTRQKIKVLGMS